MKQKDIVFILASVFFVIVVWIIFDIYHSSVSSTISGKLNSQIVPIKADFDLKTIENIKSRKTIEPLYKSAGSIAPVLTQSPNASPTPTIQLVPTEAGNNQASKEGALLQ
jgi:hypothetical protein